jgi:hypothetical protein
MSTDSIEDILAEEERRDAWKKRLEHLDQSRQDRRERLLAALGKLSGLIPREGQVLSTTHQMEFADELMAARRILEENGLSQALKKVSHRLRDTSDRNLQVAVTLLAEESTPGILRRLEQIGRRPAQRDPHDPEQICQAEIFRHFRGLLGQLIQLEDFPEQAESVELQMKLRPSVFPPSPPSPGRPDRASADGGGPAAATDAGEPETESPGTATVPRVNGKAGPHFEHWAFGMEAEGIWHVFRRVTDSGQPSWRHQRKVRGLSDVSML